MDLEKAKVTEHVKAEHRDGKGEVFGKVLTPKFPSWARLRKIQKASEHVRLSLAGEADTIKCLECGESERIQSDGAQDRIDNFARIHFYRHDLINKFC